MGAGREPTKADCDDVAAFFVEWCNRFPPDGRPARLLGDILSSFQHHVLERDGFFPPDACHDKRIEDALRQLYPATDAVPEVT